jgi:hypothetical protein
MKTNIMALMLCGLMLMLSACSSPHYRVTDPASGKTYYTTKINDAGRAGAVKIRDEKTGSLVTLQSSEVKEISTEEYETGLRAQLPAVTQPADMQ